MNADLGAAKQKQYVFTEAVFDGTSAPFPEAVAEFERAQRDAWEAAGRPPPGPIKVLMKDPERRAVLLFFGQQGLEPGDAMDVPIEWQHVLGPTCWWEGNAIRFTATVRSTKHA